MPAFRRLLLALVALLSPLLAWAQAPGSAGTYRAQAGDAVLLVRAGADGRIDLHHAGTGKSLTVATVATAVGLTGLLPTGEVVALGDVLGRRHLLVGATLLPLAAVTAAEWQAATARRAPAAAAAAAVPARGMGGSLGGTALLYAKSSNGYGQVRRFDLCSDGTFYYRFEELQSSNLGNAAGERTDAGTWSLNGSQLTVHFRAQGTRTYAVQPRSASSVALDGTVFAAERSQRCR